MDYEMTFEQIDEHISNSNLSEFEDFTLGSRSITDNAADTAGVLEKICKIYHVIRPILVIISKIPLLKQSWRSALKTFILTMDSLCPKG